MLAPLVISVLASLKTTQEAAAIPPTYLPHQLSLDSYARLWNYQDGLPTYLLNSGGVALLTIAFCLLLTIPAGYALARFPIPGKEIFFVFLLLALIIPYQALLTPIFFMFATLEADQLARRARDRAHRDPASVQRLHHAQQFRGGAAGTGRGGRHRRLLEHAGALTRSSSRRSGRRSSRSRSSPSSPRGTSSSARW